MEGFPLTIFACLRCGHRPCTCKAPGALPLFDTAGAALKARGQARTEANENKETLESLREFARIHARRHGTVTSDDVREFADRSGAVVHHPSVWGVIFRGGEWEPTGEWVQSKRSRNNARAIKVWRLKG